jgi:hypothetical protein
MKKILLLLSVVALTFTGCYEDLGPEQPDVNDIVLGATEGWVSADAGEWTVSVTSDYAWTASSNVSWITVLTTYGYPGTTNLKFKVAKNTTKSERTGYITVSCEDYNLSATLTVVQEAGAGAEFELSVSNITTTSADIKIVPTSEGRTYYWNIWTAAEMAEYDSTAALMNEWYETMVAYVDQGYYDWVGNNGLLDQGVVEFTTTKLKPNTEYVLWAFGIDANGNLTSADLTCLEFKSAVSTFDTASWAGVWTITSPMTYLQQQNLVTESYEEAWLEEPLTRNVEIVDGATMDSSLEGYGILYGWDGYFLMDGPAIGVYNDNKFELLNNEIIYEDAEQGVVYQWLAQSSLPTYDPENLYMVGGEYTAYTLEMKEDGSVAINGYVGQITTGDAFYVVGFSIFPVVGGDVYVWNYSEPAYTFAGNTMTAVKSNTRALASTSSASKKNVRVMHKHANAQFNAKHLTASRFVK